MPQLLNKFIVFSRHYKNEEQLGHSFFSYIKIKWSTWVSLSFKAALYYSWLYRSIHISCHDTTLKKIFSIEKLNLVGWGEWTFGGWSLLGRKAPCPSRNISASFSRFPIFCIFVLSTLILRYWLMLFAGYFLFSYHIFPFITNMIHSFWLSIR